MTSVVLTRQASADLEQAFAHYFDAVDLALAERFRDAADAALAHIARHPGTGSPRYARGGELAGLRFWTLNDFPFAVFYLAGPQRIDVLRVLHQASDIPHHLLPK